MKEKRYDAVVIGGGAAGMAAALEIAKEALSVALVERENSLGGILNQCIHNGFGLHYFKEDLTGPEFAEKLIRLVEKERSIEVFTTTTIMEVAGDNGEKALYGYSSRYGLLSFTTKAVVLAMGCRERNRGNIMTPGTRPAGIFTAGLAQRLVNIEGYTPGKEVVIVGSGDIGLIMARRMTWIGARVKAVVEIQPYPAGLTRNIVQCLNDFDIPLYLSHVVSYIHGKDRVEAVEITPVEHGILNKSKSFILPCDTILLSVGLIPDNEISKKFGLHIHPVTQGAVVDSHLMTSVEGIFACGNVLHVHDLVDWVCEEAGRCGKYLAQHLKGKLPDRQYPVIPGANIRYIVPNRYNPAQKNSFFLRSMIVKNRAELVVKIDGKQVKSKKLSHVQPSEMISITLKKEDFMDLSPLKENRLEISVG